VHLGAADAAETSPSLCLARSDERCSNDQCTASPSALEATRELPTKCANRPLNTCQGRVRCIRKRRADTSSLPKWLRPVAWLCRPASISRKLCDPHIVRTSARLIGSSSFRVRNACRPRAHHKLIEATPWNLLNTLGIHYCSAAWLDPSPVSQKRPPNAWAQRINPAPCHQNKPDSHGQAAMTCPTGESLAPPNDPTLRSFIPVDAIPTFRSRTCPMLSRKDGLAPRWGPRSVITCRLWELEKTGD